MRSKFIPILFMTSSFSSFSQLKDTLEAKKFWSDNIANIVSISKEKILTQTHFPLELGNKKSLTKEQFRVSMGKYLNPALREELGKQDVHYIDSWKMAYDSTQTYMLVCYKGLENQYEAVVLCFFQYKGKWMLNRMDYHKKDEY